TWTTVDFDQVVSETNISFDTVNNQFVVPSDGIYQFNVNLKFDTVLDQEQVLSRILVNGSAKAYGQKDRQSFSTDYVMSTLSWSGSLKSGDNVKIQGYHGGSGTEVIGNGAVYTWWTGHKVSGTSTGVEYDNYDIGFDVTLSADSSIDDLTITKVPFDSIITDNGNNFDTTNNRFIAPVSGLYSFSSSLYTSQMLANSRIGGYFHVNGVSIGLFNYGANDTDAEALSVAGSRNVNLNAGDYVEVFAFQDSGGTEDIRGLIHTSFSGHLIRAITKAEFSFHMYLSADQSLTTPGAWQKINLNAKRFDYGNNVDTTTNNRIDIPEDGRYIFNFSVGFKNLLTTTSNYTTSLRVNGSNVSNGNRSAGLASTTLNNVSNGSVILDLVKGDYVELYAFQDESSSETARGLSDITFISGYRLVTSQDTPKITKDLSDVSSQQAGTNDVLLYNGTEYVPTNVLNDEVSFEATISAQYTRANISAPNLIELDTIVFDNGNNFDTNTYEFVVPVTGQYSFSVDHEGISLGADERTILRLDKNGTIIRFAGSHNSIADANVLSNGSWDAIELIKGDKISFYVQISTASTAYDVGTRTRLSGHLISPAVVLAPNGINHAFYVSNVTAGIQTIISGYQIVILSDNVFSENIDFDFTANKFVAPSTGTYHITGRVSLYNMNSGTTYFTYLIVPDNNTKGTRDATTASAQYRGGVVAATLHLTAGQTVGLGVWTGSASGTIQAGTHTETYLTGHKVSGTSTGVEYDSYDIAFRAYQTPAQADIVSGVVTEVEYDVLSYDKGGNFSLANNEFIVPEDGLYSFTANVTWENIALSDDVFTVYYDLNGTDYVLERSLTGTGTAAPIFRNTFNRYLSAGDTISISVKQDTGSSYTFAVSETWATEFSGYLVKAITKAECSFMANLNQTDDTTSIVSTGDTIIPLHYTEYNYGNNFDTGTGRFTAPESGRYLFAYSVQIESISTTGKEVIARLFINGSAKANGSRSDGTVASNGSTGSIIYDLTKDDYVELSVYQSESASETISGYVGSTYLSGYRLVSSQDIIQATSIDDLTDVDTTTLAPSANDVLEWDGANWIPTAPTGGGGASVIDDLTDVDTTTAAPSANDFLRWDNTNWVPYTLPDYVLIAGDAMTGNLTLGTVVDSSADRSLKVFAGDSKIASLEAYGNINGTGRLYVGQSDTFGGGICYNGDDTPDLPFTQDHVSFYRRKGGDVEVFNYSNASNTVFFHGVIDSDIATGTAPFVIDSTTKVTNLNADLLDGNEADAFATKLAIFNNQTGTTYTIASTDNGKIITFNNAASIAVTLPDTLATDFQCTIVQVGAGVPTVTPNTDTINGAGTGVAPSAQWKGMYLSQYSATNWLALL
ncbi:hypothetical protein GQ473_01425, partial [archaeon]|nr:hypothetical protein [archaeon]